MIHLSTAWITLLLAAMMLAEAVFPDRCLYGESSAPLGEPGSALQQRLQSHVRILAGEIGERNLWRYESLEAAAGYIEKTLEKAGLVVRAQAYAVEGKVSKNLVAEIPGKSMPEEIVLIGAHYDSVLGSPGANDNASGVAALLEIASQLAGSRPERTLRFAAFVNEEPPLFKSRDMGSQVYARRARKKGDNIVAMLSLETIGYYSQAEGSQAFPFFLLRFFYPTTGNFIAFVTNYSSRALQQQSLAAFRQRSPFPAEGLVAPGWLIGVDWSDHWSFWKEGYPAIMITDSALFRYPHYHSPEDTPEKLRYPEMAKVVAGLVRVVEELAARPVR